MKIAKIAKIGQLPKLKGAEGYANLGCGGMIGEGWEHLLPAHD
jgi:hypothetical protein